LSATKIYALAAGVVAGEAAPKCLGRPSTIVGTESDDTLLGTSEGLIDVIVGLGGDDVIKGRGGTNRICGGQGNDTLSSSSADDRLAGGVWPRRVERRRRQRPACRGRWQRHL
jgi:Ca2+-binding RTX toxin-like protein